MDIILVCGYQFVHEAFKTHISQPLAINIFINGHQDHPVNVNELVFVFCSHVNANASEMQPVTLIITHTYLQ